MVDRLTVLVGTGVLAAGLSAAVLTGAGPAVAAPDDGAGGATTSSQTDTGGGVDSGGADDNTAEGSASTGADTSDSSDESDIDESDIDDADIDESGIDESDVDESDVDESGIDESGIDESDIDGSETADESDEPGVEQTPGAGEGDVAEPAAETGEAEAAANDPAPTGTSDTAADTAGGVPAADPAAVSQDAVDPPADAPEEPVIEAAVQQTADTPDAAAAAAAATAAPDAADAAGTAAESIQASPQASTQTSAKMVMTASDDAAVGAVVQPRQTLISAVSTYLFNLYGIAMRVIGGPPLLPWGSTVTTHSSKLEIDCGEGYEVYADWFVPEGPTPERLIYFQHGFGASGPMYSYTASRLAEATHSIVVAPSLTSNFLACDGCWVGGTQMHAGVAKLFVDGDTALADSATAAGFSATLLDGVQQVVLMGHSAGGGVAAGTAGYMADNGSIDRLAGVVLLDGVGFGSVAADALAKLPDDLPFYDITARPYFWNMNGTTATALAEARPDQFIGLQLVNGSHADYMLGGNPIVQAMLNLVTGWSEVENVKAAEKITAAWVNDMFAGTQTAPYYGEADEVLQIDTSLGTASAYVMPGPPAQLTFVDRLVQFFSNILFAIDFATCATDPEEFSSFSAPDTLLSLDGRAKPGQSNGQHVCMG